MERSAKPIREVGGNPNGVVFLLLRAGFMDAAPANSGKQPINENDKKTAHTRQNLNGPPLAIVWGIFFTMVGIDNLIRWATRPRFLGSFLRRVLRK